MAGNELVTLGQLQALCITQDGRVACAKYLAPLNAAMRRFKITTYPRITMFLAQIAHESGDFIRVTEGLNYSAYGLASTWPSRYAVPDGKGGYVKVMVEGKPRNKPNAVALQIERKPEAIANSAYANRFGNGAEASGDGWRYRGAGLKQLTFKDNHLEFGKAVGLELSLVPDYLRLPEGAALSAGWYWFSRGLNELADAGNFKMITEKINGGQIGASQRLVYLERAQRAMSA
ncbi:glycoside hydrolase family 19 protein [Pseudomonas sp. SWRI74]|uniref:Glycoside hydrolase family 19 protein n=1 Tax=Pseudomonas azerbaijanoccidentalis TaxID=2842347 RepID=A0ABS6QZF3_9PSED|nr:glycoside hydrolase family 19 protein [Pseudomonas azerbaijanoccidentalis]MBV4524318.1 glycoside hydrolase family 19 protein [Pseudomonas azerbaijanoccidentalis]